MKLFNSPGIQSEHETYMENLRLQSRRERKKITKKKRKNKKQNKTKQLLWQIDRVTTAYSFDFDYLGHCEAPTISMNWFFWICKDLKVIQMKHQILP